MRGQKRPPRERARAVGIALVSGVPVASQVTGIPETTIRGWQDDPEFAELRTRTKEAVTDEWWLGVQLAFRRTIELLAKTDDPVKAATAGAIIFDKTAMARGEATGRTESRDLTKRFDDHELTTIRDFIDHIDGPAGAGDEGVAASPADPDRAEVR